MYCLPSQAHNFKTLRANPLGEISGSLGDLGTLLPLLIALTLSNSIDLSTTLVFTGLANILTGLLFSVPLPVQPMKAVAAVAISRKFTKPETASAGLFVSAVVGLLSVTGTLNWIGRVVPIPVVKGIQVGAGLSLVLSAGSSQLQGLGWTLPAPTDNLVWAIAAFLALLVTSSWIGHGRVPRIPLALLVTIVGIAIGIGTTPSSSDAGRVDDPAFLQIWDPKSLKIKWSDFRTGALTAGLGQLPLTILNSIIAVTHLSAELLPEVSAPSPNALGISIAVMNLVSCPFGAMPTCHGSGGLAGQYRFGARSGVSIIMLGIVKLVLGLIIHGAWLVEVLERFPKALLGVMVLAAGVELARAGEGLNAGARDLWEQAEESEDEGEVKHRELSDDEKRDRWMVMMLTVGGLLAFRNDAVGFTAGLLAHASVKGPQWLRVWSRSHLTFRRHGDGEVNRHIPDGNSDERQRLLA